MPKIIAAMNVTFDGFCDHTAGIANAEVHQFFTDLLNKSGIILYGKTTYQMMEEYWPNLVKKPSGEKTMDDFAVAIENIQKVLFSKSVKSVSWHNARLAAKDLKDEVSQLKQQSDKDVLVGSPSLILELTKLGLIDEWQLCVHPVVIGKGMQLFKDLPEKIVFNLQKVLQFKTSGHVVVYYTRGVGG